MNTRWQVGTTEDGTGAKVYYRESHTIAGSHREEVDHCGATGHPDVMAAAESGVAQEILAAVIARAIGMSAGEAVAADEGRLRKLILAALAEVGANVPGYAWSEAPDDPGTRRRHLAEAAIVLARTPEGGWPETRQAEASLSQVGAYTGEGGAWQADATPEQARRAVALAKQRHEAERRVRMRQAAIDAATA
jgi:hypothetical protein